MVPKMNKPKVVYFVMLGLNILLGLLILGVVFMGEAILKTHSDVLVSKKLENTLLEQEQTALRQARNDLNEYAQLKNIAKQVVPQEKDQAKTVREIIALANKAGVDIGSITFPASNLGDDKNKATISQAEAVPGTNGLYSIDITVISDAQNQNSYPQLIQFLKNLENNRRTAQVSEISIQPDPRYLTRINFSLTLKVFIKPEVETAK
jgi:hypothetical protein